MCILTCGYVCKRQCEFVRVFFCHTQIKITHSALCLVYMYLPWCTNVLKVWIDTKPQRTQILRFFVSVIFLVWICDYQNIKIALKSQVQDLQHVDVVYDVNVCLVLHHCSVGSFIMWRCGWTTLALVQNRSFSCKQREKIKKFRFF